MPTSSLYVQITKYSTDLQGMIAHSTFLSSESYRLFNVKQALVNLIKYNIYFLQLGDMNELYAFSIILNLIN